MIKKLEELLVLQQKHFDPGKLNTVDQAVTQEIIDKINEIVDWINRQEHIKGAPVGMG